MVDKLGLNASYSTNSQSSQNSSDVSQNDLKKTVIYEHSVFGIKDTDGKVGVEDLQSLNGAHRVKNDAAYDLRAEICDFFGK